MKVLMTADTVGGVWTYAVELTRMLPEVEFVIGTMGPRPTDDQRAQVSPNARLVDRECKLEWMDDPWTDVAAAGEWLLELADQVKPDLVHVNGYTHAELPFPAPKFVVAHSCVMSWWRAVKGEDAPAHWNTYRENVERGLRAADLIVAPSASMLAMLDEHYRFTTPGRVIYNARTMPKPARQNGPRTAVFAAGRLWDEAKNLKAVAAAAPQIAWPVIIAGDGGSSGPNVTYVGRLDHAGIQEAFSHAGIYLLPALYEPFGLSILEAALAGCALVLGDITSLREIWADAAVFVPPRDPAAIADAVNELADDEMQRIRLGSAARERAKLYTPERMAAAYRATYAELSARGVARSDAAAAAEARA